MDKNYDVMADANKSMERNLIRNESAIFASYGLVGAILLFGAGGYLLDRWLDTSPCLLLLGLVTDVGTGFFGLTSTIRQR